MTLEVFLRIKPGFKQVHILQFISLLVFNNVRSFLQLILEAGVGSGHLGDIAVDDIQVLKGPCLDEYNDGRLHLGATQEHETKQHRTLYYRYYYFFHFVSVEI